jgi:hypothetical protein
MSTLANITSLNLSLQTGGAALAVKAVKSVAKPARTVYVFGTADDVAPNFTTVSGALTYANSLTPIVTEPVVIRTFTKADGTPYTLAGLSSWTTYANSYIYFVSDFVRLNETTTLPTTLPAGLQVWYIDPNGVETLWVGNESGTATPSNGYYEYIMIGGLSSSPGVVNTLKNTIPFFNNLTFTRTGTGTYALDTNQTTLDPITTCFVSLTESSATGSTNIVQLRVRKVKSFGGDTYKIVFTTLDASGALVDAIVCNFNVHVIVRG